jgi:hypothetical protein
MRCVRHLLKQDADPDKGVANGKPSLTQKKIKQGLVANDDMRQVRRLLKQQADPDKGETNGKPSLTRSKGQAGVSHQR